MRVRIVLACPVVSIPVRAERSKPFQPVGKVLVKAGFVIVDKYAGGDVHGIYEAQTFPDAALCHNFGDIRSYVDECQPVRSIESQVLGPRFHAGGCGPAGDDGSELPASGDGVLLFLPNLFKNRIAKMIAIMI